MAAFVKGEVVVMPFPYSDLSTAKRRPALVVATTAGNDVILCAITAQSAGNADEVPLLGTDFLHGSLQRDSHIRPDHLLTADEGLILYRVGTVTPAKLAEAATAIIRILTR